MWQKVKGEAPVGFKIEKVKKSAISIRPFFTFRFANFGVLALPRQAVVDQIPAIAPA